MKDALVILQQLGYHVHAQGDQLHLRWRGKHPPPRARVLPLLHDVQRRKADILAALAQAQEAVGGREAHPRTPMPRSGGARADHQAAGAREQPAPDQPVFAAAYTDGEVATLDRAGSSPDEATATRAAMTDAIDPQASGAGEAAAPADRTRCGWCGSTRLWPSETGSGRVFCEECHAPYNPSAGCWSPGDSAKRQAAGQPLPAPSPEETQSDGGHRRRARFQHLDERRCGPDAPEPDVPDRQISPPVPADRGRATRHPASPQPTTARAAREARPARRRPGRQSTNVERRASTPRRARQAERSATSGHRRDEH
jgi:hypothetical protein